MVFKNKFGLNEQQIGEVLELERSGIYHSVETAKNSVARGDIEYIRSVEIWRDILSYMSLDSDMSDFETSLKSFIEKYKENNVIDDEFIVESLNKVASEW